MTDWTASDLRAWRSRLGWTQKRAAEELLMHLFAYKGLEGGKPVTGRLRKLAILIEREHVRTRYSTTGSGMPGGRQVFSSADHAAERMAGLERDEKVAGRLRYLSLFSGIEAATAAFERLGSDAIPAGFAETNAAANTLLRYRWPDVPRLGDVQDVDWSALRGHVDLVVGGPPCQSFSSAGKRLGIGDPRGNLSLHFLRAVGSVQPRWVLFENVHGLLSANDGVDFGILVDELESLGYAVCWRVLDARHFGVPQRRRRLWLVAERSRSARGPAAVLDLPGGAEGHPGAGSAAWATAPWRAAGSPDRVEDADIDWAEILAWLDDQGARRTEPAAANDDVLKLNEAVGEITAFQPVAGARARSVGASTLVTPTLGSISGGNRAPAVAYRTAGGLSVVRRLTPAECARLQGFDDGWLDGPRLNGKPLTDADRYRLIGNSWPVPVAAWILERLIAVHRDDSP